MNISTMRQRTSLLLLLLFSAQLAANERAIDAIKKAGGEINRRDDGLEVEFHLTGRDLRDGQLAVITQLPDITSLNLKRTRITDAGMKHLTNLTSLEMLHLEQTAVSDQGVVHLTKLVNLEYLNLYGTNVTDDALPHLKHLKRLRRLYVWQTKITDRGARELEQAIPGLQVVRGLNLDTIMIPNPNQPEKRPTAILRFIPTTNAAEAPRSSNGENIEVLFENKSKTKIKIYWVGYNGEHKLYGELKPDGMRRQNSYENNTWLITDKDDNPLGYFICSDQPAVAVIPE